MNIQQRAARGQPLNDLLVIDAHAHLGYCPVTHAAYADPSGLLASMDRIGIDVTCVSSFWALGCDYRRGNDRTAQVVREHPGRLLGYAALNPNYPNDLDCELVRCLDEQGLWAVKLHPAEHRYPPDGPVYQRVYAAMQERGGVVLSHSFGDPRIMDRLSAAYPDVVFIWGHAGGRYDDQAAPSLAALLRERDNVYVDTVLSVVLWGDIERWLEAAGGASKILFGTDVPFLDNAHQIGRITHARLPDRIKREILGLNAKRLFDRYGVSLG